MKSQAERLACVVPVVYLLAAFVLGLSGCGRDVGYYHGSNTQPDSRPLKEIQYGKD